MASDDMMTGLLQARLLDAKGNARRLTWSEVQAWSPDDGYLWLHFDYSEPVVQEWFQQKSDLDPIIVDALLSEETRPRSINIGDGLLIALRGVNLNPGADPEDMVSIRLWAEEHRVISTRKRKLFSVDDLIEQMERGTGPCNIAEFLVSLIDLMVWRISDIVDDFEDHIGQLEENILSGVRDTSRYELAGLRRQTIAIRRYLAPQREALSRLVSEKMNWIDEEHRMQLREVSDRLTRHIEDIDAIRERTSVAHEELLSRASEELNKRMYVLSIVAAVFLPLGFFTGLLGINVGGIPGAEYQNAFAFVVILLLIVVIIQLLLFRWKKWL